MRIVFFGNNWPAWQILRWLVSEDKDEIAAVVVHPAERRRFGAEILEACGAGVRGLDGARPGEPDTVEALRALGADMGVAVSFGYLLRPPILDLFPRGCVNLHPALLPYNRGAYPNVWSIVDGTPAGATLHWIDRGVDTGDVIAQ